MKKFICLQFIFFVYLSQAQFRKCYMMVGTYTSGISKGIYVYKVNVFNGKIDSVGMFESSNPSYLAVSDLKTKDYDHIYVYAVNEDASKENKGSVSAYELNRKNGKISFINTQASGGNHPCHISIDLSGKWLAVSNYTSGSISILPINSNGSVEPVVATITHKGSSVNKERQNEAHAHCAVFSKDNKHLLVADLGIDKVMVYPFDYKTGNLDHKNAQFVNASPGAGPRQIAFNQSGKYAYVIEELSGSISVYNFSDGKLSLLQNITTKPEGFTGFAGSADIHISNDGKFLYASNRGESNTLAIFKIEENGMLKLAGHQSTLGSAPRYFSLTPGTDSYLWAANQNSDAIVLFKRNSKNGMLTETGKRIKVGKPVCIKWAIAR